MKYILILLIIAFIIPSIVIGGVGFGFFLWEVPEKLKKMYKRLVPLIFAPDLRKKEREQK